ncbi:MAG: branched-chain amino acid ABC transporter permease [Chthoniobacterales bacterium]|nr:branched-chain amino acid ABC transporter permease [Chthoniobacterales bacterium]
MESVRRFCVRVAECRWILPLLLVIGMGFCVAAESGGLLNSYTRFVLITMGVNIILCASLNLVNGYLGEFSVGHAGFMALGAYAAAMMTTRLFPQMPALFLPAIFFGGLVAAVIGFLLALLSFKTRGDYLALITLAFLMIVKSALENIPWVGGPRGLAGIPTLSSLPITFGAAIVTLWVIRNLVFSKFGRAVVAIREDEIAANSMGVRTREAKILAFSVSSFFGGVAGALLAHQITFINPGSFDILKSTEILVMVYLGGIGSLAGSVLGAVIFTLLSEVLRDFGTWRMVILPLILVLLMLFRPRGIMGLRELPWFLPRRELTSRRKKP